MVNMRKMGRLGAVALVAAGIGGLWSSAQAAVITPVSATGATTFPGYPASNAIDGNNITEWVSNGGGSGPNAVLYLSLLAPTALMDAVVIDRTTVNGGFGIDDFTTSFSLTVYSDSLFTTATSTYSATRAVPGGTPATRTMADFTSTVALGGVIAQYIRYNVTGSLGANTGVAEIFFDDQPAAAVPEPASLSILALGLGAVGLVRRRRNAAAAA